MKKAFKVTMIAILAVTLVFGSVSTAFATEGTGIVAASGNLTQVSISSREPSDQVISDQPFVVKNPNSVPVRIEYGVIKNSQYQKIGNIDLLANEERKFAISDPGLAGITAYVGLVGADDQMTEQPHTMSSTQSYWLYVQHVDQKTGQVILTEDYTYYANASVYPKGTAVSNKASITYNGKTYKPVATETKRHFFNGNATQSQRTLRFEYVEDVKENYNVTILYMNGNVEVGRETIEVQAPNGQVSLYPNTTSFAKNNRDYTIQANQKTQTHRYGDATREYIFYYDASAEAPKGAYYISVRYKDATTGAIIAKRNVSVAEGKTVTVTLPDQYSAGNGKTYAKVSSEVSFTHAHKDHYKGITYDFLYKEVKAATEPYNIKIVYADASTGSTLNAMTKYVAKSGSATQEIPSSLTINGSVYYLASGQPSKITHDFTDAAREYKVYYNKKGAEEVKPYSITVRLRRNDTNEVVRTYKQEVTIQNTAVVEIPQETITLDGVKYQISSSSIKNSGDEQDNGLLTRQGNGSLVLRHEFSDTRRTYDIFMTALGKSYEPDTDIQFFEGDPTYIDQYLGGGGADVIDGDTDTEVIDATEDEEGAADETTIPDDGTPADEGDGQGQDDQAAGVTDIDENDTPLSGFRNEDGSLKWGWIILDIALLAIVAILAVVLIKKSNDKKRQMEAH